MRALRLALLLVLVGGAARAADDDLLAEAAANDAEAATRVSSLLTAALLDDVDAAATAAHSLERLDDQRRSAGLAPTGLADDAAYLMAALAPSRDLRRKALEDLVDDGPGPAIQRLAEHRLNSDDAAAAGLLLRDDRHNRRAALINDVLRPFGVFSGTAFLAAINPILLAGSALDAAVTTAVNVWHYNRLSAPEREALVRYRTQLARDPATGDAPEIVQAIRRLGSKRADALCKDALKGLDRALDDGELERARFLLDQARADEGCVESEPKLAKHFEDALAQHAALEEGLRWPADDILRPGSDQEARDYERLAMATAAGDPEEMRAAATAFREAHEDEDLAASAAYVLALAYDLAGNRDEARKALEAAADEGDGHPVGAAATARLESPIYDPLRALASAERQHSRDVARYVLIGGGPDGRSAIYTAAHLGAEGLRGAQSLGLFNVVGVVSRAWSAWRNDPASNQAIIDRGEELLAQSPPASEAAELHIRLARAYERAGNYGRALMHIRALPAPDHHLETKLEEKLADRLLADAGDDPRILSGLAQQFADTPAAEKARDRLRVLPPPGALVVAREVLATNPWLAGPNGLGLEPTLLDGDANNGELADAGVTLDAGTMRLSVRREGRDVEEDRRLDPETYQRAEAAASAALYASLLTRDDSDPDVGRYERYIPFFLAGGIGEDGSVSVAPGLKMHRYRSETPELYR